MFMNKIAGALLAVLLVILALPTLSNIVFGKGGHHGGHHDEHEKTLNERAEVAFAYRLPLSGGGTGPIVDEVYDLGALMLNASAEDGASSFKSKCSSCHTIEAGGADKQGPNLHGVVARAMGGKAGFSGYSSGMTGMGMDWDYASLDAFIQNPKGYVDGTAMNFVGVRRDSERADILAYLASETPGAPAFPEPLPEEADDATEVLEIVEGEDGAVAVEGDAVIEEPVETGGSLLDSLETEAEALIREGEEAVDGAVDGAEEAATDLMDQAEDMVEDATNHDGH